MSKPRAVRSVRAEGRSNWRGTHEPYLALTLNGYAQPLRGPLADKILADLTEATKIRFLDKKPRNSGFQQLVVVGVPGGAVLAQNTTARPLFAYISFCYAYARRLGLTPGKVRYVKVVRGKVANG